jgi:hypothetical protein
VLKSISDSPITGEEPGVSQAFSSITPDIPKPKPMSPAVKANALVPAAQGKKELASAFGEEPTGNERPVSPMMQQGKNFFRTMTSPSSQEDKKHDLFPGMGNQYVGAAGGALLSAILANQLGLEGPSSWLMPLLGGAAGYHYLPKLITAWQNRNYGKPANPSGEAVSANQQPPPAKGWQGSRNWQSWKPGSRETPLYRALSGLGEKTPNDYLREAQREEGYYFQDPGQAGQWAYRSPNPAVPVVPRTSPAGERWRGTGFYGSPLFNEIYGKNNSAPAQQ